MTTLAWLISALALLLGLTAGAALARRPSHGRPSPGTGRPPADPVAADGPTLGELLHRTFRQSSSGLAVVGAGGEVLLYNPRAVGLGAVSGERLDPRALAACRRRPRGRGPAPGLG
ncbi:hypothetical protein [Pseudonocardia sp. ICBG1293]|uniref:hypothetical protein n=1 Tax=Pseudonocardia sp. ICBG1293 TaxID=2844382 RepID=UPI001CCE2EA6|nr:hypothetical protein [Pseudonocardia sp. ICBG1293]